MVNKTKSGIFTTILFHVASHRLGHDLRFDFFYRRFEMFISQFVLKIEIDLTASNMQRNLFITPSLPLPIQNSMFRSHKIQPRPFKEFHSSQPDLPVMTWW
jgi:hypothetical protein